ELAEVSEEIMQKLGVKASSTGQGVAELSRGNQPKGILARAMVIKPDILFLLEPTHGVDVGAKSEIYELLDQLVVAGKAVLTISSDPPELLGKAIGSWFPYRGRIADALSGADGTRENLTTLATGQRLAAQ